MKKLTAAEMHRKTLDEFRQTAKLPLVVVLENVRSMNNVGSVFRTADAFLISKIYLCGITPTPPHREITKTALGATESVDWAYENDAITLAQNLKLQGYTCLGIEQTHGAILFNNFEIQKDTQYALFFGNEVDGISEELLTQMDGCIEIPQSGTKHSLNISVAAGVVMYGFYEGLNIK
ncbi:MAG: RNA methyltransferase [Bacteroidetes bacterium]|nr:RNA methyltransferase [Bacteroidota bacterium]